MELDIGDQQKRDYRASKEQVDAFVARLDHLGPRMARNIQKTMLLDYTSLWLLNDGQTLVKEKMQSDHPSYEKIRQWLKAIGTQLTEAPSPKLDVDGRTFMVLEARDYQPVSLNELVSREVDEQRVSELERHLSDIGNDSGTQLDNLIELLRNPLSGFFLVSREHADSEAGNFCLIAVELEDAKRYQVHASNKPFNWTSFSQLLNRFKRKLRLTLVQADGTSEEKKIRQTAEVIYFRPPVNTQTASLFKPKVIEQQKQRSQEARQGIYKLKDALCQFDGESEIPINVLRNGGLACTEEQKEIVEALQDALCPELIKLPGDKTFGRVGGNDNLQYIPGPWNGSEIGCAGPVEVVCEALSEMKDILVEKQNELAALEGVCLDSAPKDPHRRVTWTIRLKGRFQEVLYDWWLLVFNVFRNGIIKLFFLPRGPAWPEQRKNYAVVPTDNGRGVRIVGPAYFDEEKERWFYRVRSDGKDNENEEAGKAFRKIMNGFGGGADETDDQDSAEDDDNDNDLSGDDDDEGGDVFKWIEAPHEWKELWKTFVPFDRKSRYRESDSVGDECGLVMGKYIRSSGQIAYKVKGMDRSSPVDSKGWMTVTELLKHEATSFINSDKGMEMYGKDFVTRFLSALSDPSKAKDVPPFLLDSALKFMERAWRSIRTTRFRGRRAGNVCFVKAESLRRNGFTLELSADNLRRFMKLSGFDEDYLPSVRRPTKNHPGVRLDVKSNQASTTVSIVIHEESLWLHFPVMRPIRPPKSEASLPIVNQDIRDPKALPFIKLVPLDVVPGFLCSVQDNSDPMSFASLDFNGASLVVAVAQFRVEAGKLSAKLSDPFAQLHAGSKEMIEGIAKLQSQVDHARQLAMYLGGENVKESAEAKVELLKKELETLEQKMAELKKLLVEEDEQSECDEASTPKPTAKSRGRGKKGPTVRKPPTTRSGAARPLRESSKPKSKNTKKKKKGGKSERKEKTFTLNPDLSEANREAVARTLRLNKDDVFDIDFLSSAANEAEWRRKALQRQIEREEKFLSDRDALLKKLVMDRYGTLLDATVLPDGLTEASLRNLSALKNKKLHQWARNWKDALPGNPVSPWTPEMWAEINKKRKGAILQELNATRTRMERRKVKKRRRFSRRVKEERNQLAAKLGKENMFIFSGKPDIQGWIKRGSRILGKKTVRALTPLCLGKFHENLVRNVMLNYGVLVYGPWEGYTTNQHLVCHQYAKATVFTNRHRKCPIEDCPSHELKIRLHRELISVCNQVIAAWCQLNFLGQLRPGKDPP